MSLVTAAAVAGAGAASAVSDFKFDRIGGADRYETSTLVDDEFRDGGADVILANGEPGNYADALSAETLAGEKNVPILLTRKDKTPASVLQQLKDDGVKNIWVVGGTSVVSDAQVASLTSAGYTVTRVAGADRFATNNEIIKMSGTAAGATGLVATGFNFPDALAAGPFSFQGHPLGLSTKDSIEDSTVAALKNAGVTKVLIFGGTDVVTPAVEAKLKAAGIDTAARFAGTDRADTSAKAAEYAVKNLGFTDTHVGVASGYVKGYGADALAGGALEGKEKSPMLVTKDVNIPGASVLDYLKAHAATLKTGHIYGGTAAISAAAEDQMAKAAQTAPASSTSLPELRSASVVGTVTAGQATPTNPAGTTVRYTFDEAPASGGGLAPTASLFHVYTNSGAPGTNGNDVVSVSGNDVVVRFTGINTTAGAAALTVATVDEGAVKQIDGKSNIIGDAPLGASSGGGTSTLPAGVTVAPDLVSVGNFRQAAASGDTAVDFTFDEAARTTATAEFQLVQLDGTPLDTVEPAPGDNSAGGGTIPGGNGTTTITVVYDGAPGDALLTAGDIARGVVAENSVEEETNNETAPTTKDKNELQAADVSNSGNSTTPDLVSVELRPRATSVGVDQALFTFDQTVTAATPADFFLYKVDGTAVPGTGTAQINSANPRQVLIDFTDTATEDAVGGNIVAGAVTPSNAPDEVGVANTTTNASQTAGKTSAPDLTGVALSDKTNVFGTVTATYATYTFDEVVASVTNSDYVLYLSDGTRLDAVAASCTIGPDTTTTADDNTVRCEFAPGGTPASASYAKAATVGAVDDGAAADAGGALSPEGAENTSGGTGTPAA